MENLICVDIFDNEISRISKVEAHTSAILHRAFSVVLYHENKMLIQQRAFDKYHSGGLWANTCCSHPRSNNLIVDAIKRLKEEVGIECDDLKELFSFTYFHKFNEHLFEYEYDHVLVGDWQGEYKLNLEEVSKLEWVDIDDLSIDLRENPEKYSVWFLILAPKVIEYIKSRQALKYI